MTALEEINKPLEGVTPDRLRYEADAMFAAVQGEQYGDTFHAYNWADKPHRVLYDAVGLMRDAATTLESLQCENEELRQRLDIGPCGEDAIDVAESAADHLRHRAEAAEAEVKRLRVELAFYSCNGSACDCIPGQEDANSVTCGFRARQALASTGGEHHAE